MRETENSIESESQLSDREIIENQANKFLLALGSRERTNLPKSEYQLHLPEVEEMVRRMVSDADTNPARIEAARNNLMLALNPIYEKNQLIGLVDDDVYAKKERLYREEMGRYLKTGKGEDVIPAEEAKASLRIHDLAADLERTPRGKLMRLYATLDREVGK